MQFRGVRAVVTEFLGFRAAVPLVAAPHLVSRATRPAPRRYTRTGAPTPREMAVPSADPTENLVPPGVAAEESRETRLRRGATDAKLHMTERECSQSLQALFTQLGFIE
eukprot:6863-Pleurochrysis_carterae.AAC.1